MIAYVVVGAVFGFGLAVVGAIVFGRVRDKRRWSSPSLEPSAYAGESFEDPAAGGSTAGAESNTTDAWAVAQTTARVRTIRSSPGSGSLGL